MKLETAAYLFLIILGILIIGTLIDVEDPLFDDIWFCVNYFNLITVGIYFITNTKKKLIKHALIGLTAWMFSALCFRVIYMGLGISTYDERPMDKHTVLWYILVFIFYLTIGFLNERFTNIRTTKVD